MSKYDISSILRTISVVGNAWIIYISMKTIDWLTISELMLFSGVLGIVFPWEASTVSEVVPIVSGTCFVSLLTIICSSCISD